MKKFYSFFLVAVCLFATSFAYAATRTVYFQDDQNWANQGKGIQIYMWNSANGTNSGWDNESNIVTELVSGTTYKYEITNDDWDKVIFHTTNNYGPFQTETLDIRNNGIYTDNGDKGNLVQIYFDDFNSKWGNISLQNWDNNGVNAVSLPTNGDIYSWLVLENSWFLFHYNDYKEKTADVNGTDKIYYYTEFGKDSSFPLDIYAVGEIGFEGATAATSWAPDNGDFKLSYSGSGVFEIKNIQMFEEGETGYSAFRFHTKLGGWKEDSGTHYRPTEDKVLNVGTGTSTTDVTTDATDDRNWKVVTAYVNNTYYVYDLKLDLLNNKLTIDGTKHTTGVESISVEDSVAPVEYFNLQGVRVENPENGLYIVRQGNKVSKQLIR